MADTTPTVTSSDASTPPSSASEQARLRKERREAKIRTGGSARLNKITGLGGGVERDAPVQPTASEHDDPAEVDISNHFYEPKRTQRPHVSSVFNADAAATPSPQMSDDAFRQMMLGRDPATLPSNPDANPFAGLPGFAGLAGGAGGLPGADGPDANDPLMKMMRQMIGAAGGAGGGDMPTFPGMGPAGDGASPGAQADPNAYLWRIVHAIFALSLGIYIAFTTPFTGTKLAREAGMTATDAASASATHFFYIFATAELVLQTSRFFIEKGQVAPPKGILGMVMGVLPEPFRGYLVTLLRYARIWTTVTGDAFVCVFVIGVCAWWRDVSA